MRSLRWFAVAAVALVLAGPVSAQQMRERITAEQLTGLLRDKGLSGQVNERGNVVVENNGSKIVFFISGQTMQAYFGLRGTSANVNTINEWNKSKRFGRAYIDTDGDPCVELDFDLEGGVSDESVKVWFDTVTAIVRSFRAHVSK
ncbi:MAG: YbjN domain-containing protein [Gemmatimonadaceae bacterium]|nr:YbjN domain-containing protein [Gemmatimonadaceae bacterium]